MVTRLCTALVALASVFALSIGTAGAAGEVTVKYRVFPDGGAILPPEIVKGSVTDTAKGTLFGKTPGVSYEFLFWDVDGSLDLHRKISYTPPGGTSNFATAWYLLTGGGGGACAPHCAVATWAFSLQNDKVITGTTPIASVTPSGLWTSPSTTVSTMTSSSSVSITALATLSPPATFHSWLELPRTKVAGDSLSVPAATDAEAIAFYRAEPVRPPKLPPCPSKTPDCHM